MEDDLAAAPEQHGELPEPSPEVVEAYLLANEEYWRRIDDEPMKLGKWRNGTVQEATAYALRTAIAAERRKTRLLEFKLKERAHPTSEPRDPPEILSSLGFWPACGCGECYAIHCLGEAQAELSTLRQQLAEAGRDGWTDAEADAARLALELECLLTDKDVPMPALSRWWDSAHEALELHRARFRTAIAAQGERS